MGNVQGDKKLNTPAMNANKVRATIPESGRLGLGWKGFSGADFETVDSVAVEEREGLMIVGEETELFRTFRKEEVFVFMKSGWVTLEHRNPTSGAGSSALEYCR